MFEVRLPAKVTTNVYYRTHYRARTPLHDSFYKAVWDAIQEYKVKPVKDYPINVTYAFYLRGNAVDWVNLSAMTKIIEDALVTEGILTDDSPKYIAQGMMIPNKSKRKYDYCIVELS